MTRNEIIAALSAVGALMQEPDEQLSSVLRRTEINNPWFTDLECRRMLSSFSELMLNKSALETWAARYEENTTSKTVGLVLAGNVPFVGMHDIICVLVSGHKALIKLSSKDSFFFPWFKQQLVQMNAGFDQKLVFTDKLEQFDAIIATGSNNSARYFEYYFGKYPNIIRKNRTSVAILTGNESEETIYNLGKDVFYYYGLGCRNVSKVFIPEHFDKQLLFKYWEDYRYVTDNTKFKNNYDYNRALLMLNNTSYLTNDFYMLVDSDQLHSPLSVLYCETYFSEAALQEQLDLIAPELQCVVAAAPGNTAFGKTQFPGLSDYADFVDTMLFLNTI